MNLYHSKMARLNVGLVMALMFPVSTPTFAKCISLQITLQGTIAGAARDLTVSVGVASSTKGDSRTEVNQESSTNGSHFYVNAFFNTASNVIRDETCDRTPDLVVVKLMKEKAVLDQQTLKIETSFRRTKEGDYELIKPLVLHAGPGK